MVRTEKKNFGVCGMIVGNLGLEPQPAQVIAIQDGDRVIEEVKYYLPYGKALNRETLIGCLNDMAVSFAYAE